jgi:hypothetical protein
VTNIYEVLFDLFLRSNPRFMEIQDLLVETKKDLARLVADKDALKAQVSSLNDQVKVLEDNIARGNKGAIDAALEAFKGGLQELDNMIEASSPEPVVVPVPEPVPAPVPEPVPVPVPEPVPAPAPEPVPAPPADVPPAQ